MNWAPAFQKYLPFLRKLHSFHPQSQTTRRLADSSLVTCGLGNNQNCSWSILFRLLDERLIDRFRGGPMLGSGARRDVFSARKGTSTTFVAEQPPTRRRDSHGARKQAKKSPATHELKRPGLKSNLKVKLGGVKVVNAMPCEDRTFLNRFWMHTSRRRIETAGSKKTTA